MPWPVDDRAFLTSRFAWSDERLARRDRAKMKRPRRAVKWL
jgi:hypothetical protein